MTTKLPLTDERLSTISDYFVAMEEHYSDPADRENFEIFSDAKAFLAELQQRRKAATGCEAVGIKLPPKMSNDRINALELSTGVDVWNRCIAEVAKLNDKSIPSVPSGLHPDTQKLVTMFCTALAEKLYKAQLKYGHSDNWSYANWEIECQTAFHEHIAKGDPRDVAAYCAFMWYHGWRTEAKPVLPETLVKAVDFYEQVKRENPPVETGAWKDAVEWVLKEVCLAAKKDES
ncbi:hypothetical protein NGI08_23415 [Klebsiella michiganensis]|uniref:hypothetical protein n=1 Tax=Klebsiella/Raoultella group TaxID=2890311 RepID=UPI0012B8258E|nr:MULTISPECIES: hypothetical protein [Klebsiella]MEB8081730.1 hypothetical protein [Klebsiella michiganensis]